MSTIDQRIKALQEKLKQARAQKQRIEARKRNIESKKKRAEDTRRKILAGALLLEAIEQSAAEKKRVMEMLDKFLTRKDDRALFDLPPKDE